MSFFYYWYAGVGWMFSIVVTVKKERKLLMPLYNNLPDFVFFTFVSEYNNILG